MYINELLRLPGDLVKYIMNIFFGGSSSGLRKDQTSYILITDNINKLGGLLINDWVNKGVEGLTAEDSYKNTFDAIKKVQGVVLEATIQTSGLGQQLEIALLNNVPVLVLTKESETNFGNFVNPDKKFLVTVKKYNNDNLEKLIKEFIEQIGNNYSVARFNLVINKELNIYLEDKAKTNKTSKTEEIRKLIIEDMEKNHFAAK